MADVRAGTGKVKDEPGMCCLGRKEELKTSLHAEWLRRGVNCQKTLEPA